MTRTRLAQLHALAREAAREIRDGVPMRKASAEELREDTTEVNARARVNARALRARNRRAAKAKPLPEAERARLVEQDRADFLARFR